MTLTGCDNMSAVSLSGEEEATEEPDHPDGEPPKSGTTSGFSLFPAWRSAQAGQKGRGGEGTHIGPVLVQRAVSENPRWTRAMQESLVKA